MTDVGYINLKYACYLWFVSVYQHISRVDFTRPSLQMNLVNLTFFFLLVDKLRHKL